MACQADWQSRPRSFGWYLKMERRSLAIVKTYWFSEQQDAHLLA
jgi:hypothetical protein